jgi:hypothetical protein
MALRTGLVKGDTGKATIRFNREVQAYVITGANQVEVNFQDSYNTQPLRLIMKREGGRVQFLEMHGDKVISGGSHLIPLDPIEPEKSLEPERPSSVE